MEIANTPETSSAPHRYPQHIGIIMDGNGRWAAKRSLPRSAGHYEGLKAAKRVTAEASRLGIPFITYYVFSTENWRRPDQEVSYLMTLLTTKLYGEIDFYRRSRIRVLVRGSVDHLHDTVKDSIVAIQEATKDFDRATVILAINYGGQDEIVRSVNRWLSSREGDSPISIDDIEENLDFPLIPPPDLIIRSGGEKRLSNFLLWDSAYAELAFYDTLWPDWGPQNLQQACEDFAARVRRFGGILP